MLSILILLPLLGALVIALSGRGSEAESHAEARYIALFTTLVTFAVSLLLWVGFDVKSPEFQFVEKGISLFDIGS